LRNPYTIIISHFITNAIRTNTRLQVHSSGLHHITRLQTNITSLRICHTPLLLSASAALRTLIMSCHILNISGNRRVSASCL
jgi:hypothetical protein